MSSLEQLLRQHRRVVTAGQLLAVGWDSHRVLAGVRSGVLGRLFHGVYAGEPAGEDELRRLCRGAVVYAG